MEKTNTDPETGTCGGQGSRVWRALLVVLGILAVGLGIIGVFVPGLPTTIFLLLASYLFARSSPRLQRRLLDHPLLGPYLKQASRRGMSLRAKVISLIAMWTGIAVSCVALAETGLTVPIVVACLGITGTAVLLFYVRTLPVAATTSPRRR